MAIEGKDVLAVPTTLIRSGNATVRFRAEAWAEPMHP